jgi:hypothetical protein
VKITLEIPDKDARLIVEAWFSGGWLDRRYPASLGDALIAVFKGVTDGILDQHEDFKLPNQTKNEPSSSLAALEGVRT